MIIGLGNKEAKLPNKFPTIAYDGPMIDEPAAERLRRLSSGARRLLDYVAVLEPARYAELRHFARATEEDLIEDLKEAVDLRLLERLTGQPNSYVFAGEDVRSAVLADIGEARLPKLRARAEGARRRVREP